ncbi:sugar ABC transporter permease [Mycoplasma enhydrae]|uniref:carbohydrate ABC transporter permease n=1 Tax=Mycoplasma enhydrae TaxID=2499220 RepID=UPI00197BF569|nr:sugar ABC transporter permease [Mycoplasma enhydrae]MBN4089279.1 sugar ABC transporter permease [Mycoplasma enhydrae]MCV3733561.1 sugar ABC transporter permease [Mycoplasma enhydrae]MCV3753463.1 sugar ABC transporter permease [Mycoplasma enhydrae]
MKTYFWKKYRIKKSGEALSILNTRTPAWKPFLLLLPSLIALIFMVVIPFLFAIMGSFRAQGDSYRDYTWSIDNYYRPGVTGVGIFNDPKFINSVVNSIIYAILALPVGLLFSILISSAIATIVKKYARSFWQTVFFLPYMTGAVAVSLTFSAIFGKSTEGAILPWLYDTGSRWKPLIVIFIRGVWGGLAFQVLILTTAMLSVNPTLYKSSAIDGASPLKQFFKITLPSIRRTISFLFTIGIINGIKVFPLALYNNDANTAIAQEGGSLLIYIFNNVKAGQTERSMAASVFLFILGVSISFSLKKAVSLSYKVYGHIGEKNVTNKIKEQAMAREIIFKI